MPPITSITISAPEAASVAASVVNKLGSTPGRGLFMSWTATPINFSSLPIRAVKSVALSESK